MTVRVRVFEDPGDYASAVDSFVRAHPVRTTVLATVLADVLAGVRGYPGATWLVAEESGRVVGVAMQTPPYRLWLSRMPPEGAAEVASVMAGRSAPGALPGMAGERGTVAAAAQRWHALRPEEALTETRAVRMYELGALSLPAGVPGRARLAAEADTAVLHAWQRAFAEEVDVQVGDVEATTTARLDGHGAFLVWELDGAVVSLAGHTAQVSGMVRVGPVYTPPGARGRGFGGAVTAATTQHALDAGADRVVLFTDLGNPTSNAIYQQIGFRPADDFVELDAG